MSIRDAEPGDEAAWRGLWSQYLAFYDVTLTPEVTAATWARLMDPASPMKMRLAVVDGVPVGFAIHMHHPSTWVAGEDCYLEDLFVAEAARGKLAEYAVQALALLVQVALRALTAPILGFDLDPKCQQALYDTVSLSVT